MQQILHLLEFFGVFIDLATQVIVFSLACSIVCRKFANCSHNMAAWQPCSGTNSYLNLYFFLKSIRILFQPLKFNMNVKNVKMDDYYFFDGETPPINSFHATGYFLYPLKTSENQIFFDIFKGYTKKQWLEMD